jgi:hypothetical protein
VADFRGVILTWIWDDVDMTELECVVETRDFRGRATCYAGRDDAARFGQQLAAFLETHEGSVRFSAANEGGVKAVALEVFPVDGAKHLAMRVHLVTDGNPDEVSRLEHRFGVEAWALHRFARELCALRRRGDQAVLSLEETG